MKHQNGFIGVALLLLIVLASIGGIFYYGVMNGDLLKTPPTPSTTQVFDQQLKENQGTPEVPRFHCEPTFAYSLDTPELTAEGNAAMKCMEAQTKTDCEKIDNYRTASKDVVKPDGIPDCKWVQ